MRYEVTQFVGEVSITKEYEGTPKEIAELIELESNESKSVKFDIPAPEIRQAIEKVSKQITKQMREKHPFS